MGKLLNCILWLGKDIRKELCHLIKLGDLEIYPLYRALYSDADAPRFDALIFPLAVRALAKKCGYSYTKYLHSRLYHYNFDECLLKGDAPELPLPLDDTKIQECASKVGDAFMGGVGRYNVVRSLLCDDESKCLFDKEILQESLRFLGLSGGKSATLINTGIDDAMWRSLLDKAETSTILKDFVGVKKNDEYILFTIATAFLLRQYEYKDKCVLTAGDTFIDCGACYGDTTVWAMDKMGGGYGRGV